MRESDLLQDYKKRGRDSGDIRATGFGTSLNKFFYIGRNFLPSMQLPSHAFPGVNFPSVKFLFSSLAMRKSHFSLNKYQCNQPLYNFHLFKRNIL